MTADLFPNLTTLEAARYLLLQARRTEALRLHLYRRIGLAHMKSILEVGCGTGAILRELQGKVPLAAGLDPAPAPGLKQSVCGAGERLPFQRHVFQAVFLHYALLWVKDLRRFFEEVRRVLVPAGRIVLLAEPLLGECAGGDAAAFIALLEGSGIHAFTSEEVSRTFQTNGFSPRFERSAEDDLSDPEWEALNTKLLGRSMDVHFPLLYGTAIR